MSDKKTKQLGMNPSTASNRLVKDILFYYINRSEHNICFRCGQEMSRDTFSIEHKTPWLDSTNPVQLFFDLENISFSHISCNSIAARKNKLSDAEREQSLAKSKLQKRLYMKNNYSTEKRRDKKERTGW